MELLDLLPVGYRRSPETVAIEEAMQPEVDGLWSSREECLAQLDPATATWGIAYWERAIGILPDGSKPLAKRRGAVLAKLAGLGTATPEMIRSVITGFTGEEADIVERFAEYRLTLQLIGSYHDPDELRDLFALLDQLIPAHLQWDYEIIDVAGGATAYAYAAHLADEIVDGAAARQY